MPGKKQILGQEGEPIAGHFLKKKGYKLVEQKFRCPGGERDPIALDRRVIVLTEVKTCSDDCLGTPIEVVHRHKQKKMAKAAFFSQLTLPARQGCQVRRDRHFVCRWGGALWGVF